MIRRTLEGLLSMVVAAALLALAALPAGAQPAVPAVTELPDLGGLLDGGGDVPLLGDVPVLGPLLGELAGQLPAVPGLDALDPVLDQVTGTVNDLLDLVGGVLADSPVVNTVQLLGDDAIDASIAFSRETFPSSPVAIMTRDDVFADSLSSGGVQGVYGAPLLLTGGEALDPRTLAELQRLGATAVAVLGGTAAVSEQVIADLAAAGITGHRVSGASRIETSALAAAVWFPTASTAILSRAFPAPGADDAQAYADLLAVGPYAAEQALPVLLTQSDALSAPITDYLLAAGIEEVVIIGGESAVGVGVERTVQALGIATTRLAGPNRFATAVAVAEARGLDSAAGGEHLVLADGGNTRSDIWAPGMTSSAFAGIQGAPVVLSDGPVLPPETLAFILEGLTENLLDGGPALTCASFVDPAACEAAGLLLLGSLTGALDLLGLDLSELPLVADLLAQLGLLELVDAILAGTDLGPVLAALLSDPLGFVTALLEDPAAALEEIVAAIPIDLDAPIDEAVSDLLGGASGTVGDLVEDLVGGMLPGLPVDPTDPPVDPTDPPVDPILPPVDPGLPPIPPIDPGLPAIPPVDPILCGLLAC